MKNAFFIFVSILCLNIWANDSLPVLDAEYSARNPRELTSLSQSESFTTIREFMAEVHEDLESYYLISDKNFKLPPEAVCVSKTKAEVVRTLTKSIMHTLKLYPDEELPVSEAVEDLKLYLYEANYKTCTYSKVTRGLRVERALFYFSNARLAVRLDFFSPVE
ncbi:MAG: hypothetical protein L6Q33_14140 [Bacteriovoracaceae bacterium]|jgi:hypothetical protein|nr:hypothetical protein [Bacteriovoracaceae bacterium]